MQPSHEVVHVQELPRQPLYRVTFHQAHVWEGYTGSTLDTIDVEVYQAWLEPATKERFQSQQQGKLHTSLHSHDHRHHDHDHDHGRHGEGEAIDHGDHTHEGRAVVEQNAIDLEGQDDVERSRLSDALVKVIVTAITQMHVAACVLDDQLCSCCNIWLSVGIKHCCGSVHALLY